MDQLFLLNGTQEYQYGSWFIGISPGSLPHFVFKQSSPPPLFQIYLRMRVAGSCVD